MVNPTQELMDGMGKRLRELRLTYGFTQQQVADYLEIDQSNYSKIEHGKRMIRNVHQLELLSELYDCTEDYLMLRSDEYTPQRWRGMQKGMDISVIAQLNMTMRYLRVLRKVEKLEEMRKSNDEYINRMVKFKEDYEKTI